MDHFSHIRDESAAFLDAALAGPLDADVPSCPGWTVADLVGHLGVVQRFHGGHLRRGVTDPPPGPRPTPPDTDLAGWFREGTEELLGHLEAVRFDTPAWNFLGTEPRTTAFWHRRMAQEVLVHRWDAQHVRGAVAPLDPALAADGVAEVLRGFAPAGWGDRPGGVVTAVLVDTGDRVEVALGEGDAAVEIAGTAERVLLALWGRTSVLDLDVRGDVDLARAASTR